MNVVPDTSAVIDGRVSERIEDGSYEGATVFVPEAVVAELERQANEGLDTGWDGIAELQRLAELSKEGVIEAEFVGRRPSAAEQQGAGEGDIDALIRELAVEHDATLLTSDYVQAETGEATGLDVEYVEAEVRGRKDDGLAIESFFTEETMSVHLKTGTRPKAKRGTIGEMRYEVIDEDVVEEAQMAEWANDVEATARASPQGFIELSEPGMTIVQYRNYRIAVARPPFSDGIEITAVRPVAKTTLDDYEFADELRDRFLERQRGVLIAGAPGAGKSTFAQAVAEFLNENDYAVKTMEKPRDLQVSDEITQYTALGGDMAKTADSLLLVRPDYTIYDEVRKTHDFEVFADMRLAGVGLVGVTHATRAIDALQRLVGRVELGMIPQVVDTVVFIEAGEVDTVYDVTTQVKVPAGLTAEDLARPVIQVVDFETGTPAYEIYTFNRQVVTVPLDADEGEAETGVGRIAKQEIEREIRSVARGHVDVELQGQNDAVVYVDEDDISYVIGKGGGRITDIENRLGIDIDVRTHSERPAGSGGAGGFDAADGGAQGGAAGGAGGTPKPQGEVVQPEITSRHVVVRMDEHVGETVEVRAGGEYLFTATVGRGGDIQVSRGSAIAEELEDAIDRKQTITVVPA
ncbi:Flp pilus assembly complex ATPase component TadA [Halorarum halophilum]|uniref:Flp pilus assembly complex ATPase component TadA n=1 Tax=Halorarum halophilum TaxID=2743090 RepID=A0A7D5KFL9_9EURY|nr:PINc/VapC family ATPase [Halobaculum halophilum]QLG29077.1 Flp pilus assembly complex ATPase component TadA [Halobaculum halophilum]